MTLDELRAVEAELGVELQKRTLDQQLLDQAHVLVMRAKNLGFTRGQVLKHLIDVVNAYYQGGGTE